MNEAEVLFTEILNCNRDRLYLNKHLILNKGQSYTISEVLKRRMKGEPMQYILGKAHFYGLEFKVNKDVFIPRPETEILVESVLKLVSSIKPQISRINILDLGTGSGCIAVSLAKYLPNFDIIATDISVEALNIAKENARLHGANVHFIVSDLFNNIKPNTFDLIVSNPPYVYTSEFQLLQPEVKYEPRVALDGGRDGLDFYRRIIAESPAYLKPGGLLIMEMGYQQTGEIEKIFQKSDRFKIIDIIKDYNNIDRIIVAKRKKQDG